MGGHVFSFIYTGYSSALCFDREMTPHSVPVTHLCPSSVDGHLTLERQELDHIELLVVLHC